MISLTQLLISVIDKESNGEFWECANKIMNGEITEPVKKIKSEEEKLSSVEKCCNQIGGRLDTYGNNKSCMISQEQQAEYDKCMSE